MTIVDNKIIGKDVVIDGQHYNMISDEEYSDSFEFLEMFEGNFNLYKVVLPEGNTLDTYDELLLCVCDLNDNIKNTLFITRYEVCKMINNYEFSDGSWKIDKDEGDIYYVAAISVYDKATLLLSSNDVSRGYLFAKKKELI